MKAINAIRMLGMSQINEANSGHPGVVLGAAPIIHELFKNHLRITPSHSDWCNRDRFVLACGHASSMLYATLHLAGFKITIDDLKKFRKWGSLTPGHPEYKHTDGVDATSGPLGQGIAMAVGMAISEKFIAARYNKENYQLFDHYTYVICGDGDLQEGVTQEAISFAGHNGLEKLIVLYDSNDIQLDGDISLAQSELTKLKYQSMNWDYQLVEDGNDLTALNNAINNAKKSVKPSIIEVKTVIGYGSELAGKADCHGAPMGEEKTKFIKETLAWDLDDFEVSDEIYEEYKVIKEKGDILYEEGLALFKSYKKDYPELFLELTEEIEVPLVEFANDVDEATRVSNGKIIAELSKKIPFLIGGSADLTKSTKVKGADGDFTASTPTGRNINFGVREHAMAAIANGLTLSNMKAFTGGFFVFSDYMKPAMRMASLMKIPTTFVFTHDSIAVGEDGPTHQPIEQLTGLRAIPNMNVIRPANANETASAWKIAVDSKTTPTCLVLTRQNLLNNENSTYEKVLKGAYVISPEKEELHGILLACGSEVNLAISAQEKLLNENIDVRVVSIPSIYMFEQQSEEYKQSLLADVPTLAIEMATAYEYYKYTKDVMNITTFGASAPGGVVVYKYGFHTDNVVEKFKIVYEKRSKTTD